MKLPSTRIHNCLWKAIEEFEKVELLEKGEQEKLREKLNAIPINEDGEGIKVYINMKYNDKQQSQIKRIASRILKEKRKEQDKEDKEGEQSFSNNFKEATKSFQADYIDFAEAFWIIQPFYYDAAKIWWLWNLKICCWEMIDETDLLNGIYQSAKNQGMRITSSSIKSEITTALKMVGRQHKPKDAPKRWIQFKEKAFSLRSFLIHNVTHHYFFTNPIPHEIGATSDTPIMDKLFKEWVGEKRLKDLYEFIAYCCYRDYPIQLLFCLYGHGRNGKSTFINIVDKFLGKKNTCTTELDMIAGKNKSRFETIRLFKKLACFMGETNFNILENSSILKKLVGGDKIGFEVKGAGLFDDYNYAKIIIASNSLPSSEDTSEGFYRRWHILNFPNEFPEGKDISLNIPDIEYNNLAKKVIEILPKLLEEGKFTNQGTIEERKARYIMASNPMPYFIEKHCYLNPNGYIRYSQLYQLYTTFLSHIKQRIINKKEFTKVLTLEGLESRRTSKDGEVDFYVEGLEMKENCLDCSDFKKILLRFPMKEGELEKTNNRDNQDNPNTKQEELVVSEEEVLDVIDKAKKGELK